MDYKGTKNAISIFMLVAFLLYLLCEYATKFYVFGFTIALLLAFGIAIIFKNRRTEP